LAALADKGVSEAILLNGAYRVSIVSPASANGPAHTTMRPADPAISGQIRVMANLPSSAALPAEGSTITLTPESRYFIRKVWRGADGQLNVEVDQR
jgi:hypothetical protein